MRFRVVFSIIVLLGGSKSKYLVSNAASWIMEDRTTEPPAYFSIPASLERKESTRITRTVVEDKSTQENTTPLATSAKPFQKPDLRYRMLPDTPGLPTRKPEPSTTTVTSANYDYEEKHLPYDILNTGTDSPQLPMPQKPYSRPPWIYPHTNGGPEVFPPRRTTPFKRWMDETNDGVPLMDPRKQPSSSHREYHNQYLYDGDEQADITRAELTALLHSLLKLAHRVSKYLVRTPGQPQDQVAPKPAGQVGRRPTGQEGQDVVSEKPFVISEGPEQKRNLGRRLLVRYPSDADFMEI